VIPRLLAIVAFQVLASTAHACRFAQDAQPAQWYEWSNSLFSADVTSIELDKQKSLDVISVRVVETFKGPQGAAATLKVPSRMWKSCALERPLAGARVLVALNPNGDTLLVPLTESYSQRLRQHRGRQPPPTPAQSGEKPFSY
jgi:hypothetical protein